MISSIVPSAQPCLVPATQPEGPAVEMRDSDVLAQVTPKGEISSVSGVLFSA